MAKKKTTKKKTAKKSAEDIAVRHTIAWENKIDAIGDPFFTLVSFGGKVTRPKVKFETLDKHCKELIKIAIESDGAARFEEGKLEVKVLKSETEFTFMSVFWHDVEADYGKAYLLCKQELPGSRSGQAKWAIIWQGEG